MSRLYEDLIVEIFTRLPPKSLLRFRSLSKSLYSCISSPDFIRMHTFRSPQKILLVHQAEDEEVELSYTLHGEDELALSLCPKLGYIDIPTKVPFPCGLNFIIVGSYNGIFCLRSLQTVECLILWNLSIRRKLIVPKCPHLLDNDKFETGCRLDGVGFGYDPITDDYKIVWVCYAKDISFVYALKTGVWCEIASSKPHFTCVKWTHAHLLNGVLHWEVVPKFNEPQSACYILTFNLSTHVFGMIPYPASFHDLGTTGLTTIQGSLGLISRCKYLDDSCIQAWRDASWSMVFKLNTSKLYVMRALELQPQLTNNGDLLLNMYRQGLQVTNPTTGVRSKVANFTDDYSLVDFYQCVETLQLLIMGETVCETNQP